MPLTTPTKFLDAETLPTLCEYRGGKWVNKPHKSMRGIQLSMLEQLLEECGPFLRLVLKKYPDKMFFEYHEPSVEEIKEFVYM